MGTTFEERLARRFDALHQGALLLTGGDGGAAERLLTESMVAAFRKSRTEGWGPDPDLWLDLQLARGFLGALRTPAAAPVPRRGARSGDGRRTGSRRARDAASAPTSLRHVHDAAGVLRPWERAVFWLLGVQRWSYAQVAGGLGVDPELLRRLATASGDVHARLHDVVRVDAPEGGSLSAGRRR